MLLLSLLTDVKRCTLVNCEKPNGFALCLIELLFVCLKFSKLETAKFELLLIVLIILGMFIRGIGGGAGNRSDLVSWLAPIAAELVELVDVGDDDCGEIDEDVCDEALIGRSIKASD
jgi:hypothetical protein